MSNYHDDVTMRLSWWTLLHYWLCEVKRSLRWLSINVSNTRWWSHTYHELCSRFLVLFVVLLWLYYQFLVIQVIDIPMLFRVNSLALGQSYDCPSASETTLNNVGKIEHHQITTKHSRLQIVCIILGLYCKKLSLLIFPCQKPQLTTYWIHLPVHPLIYVDSDQSLLVNTGINLMFVSMQYQWFGGPLLGVHHCFIVAHPPCQLDPRLCPMMASYHDVIMMTESHDE